MHVSAQIKKKKHVVRRSIPPRIDNPFNDRRDKCPWRTSLMAAFLFSVGVIFLTAGLWKWFNTDDRKGAIAMITLGSLSAFFVGVVRDLSACLWVFVREGDCHLVAIIEGTHRRLFFLRRYPPPHHTPLVHRLPKLVLLRCFLMLGPFCPPHHHQLRAAFIPGSYASYILVGACRGWKGYHYGDVPSYDDY